MPMCECTFFWRICSWCSMNLWKETSEVDWGLLCASSLFALINLILTLGIADGASCWLKDFSRTWIIDHSSPTIYIVFQPSNPYLQGLYWWLCFGVHWEAMSTTTIRRGTCRLSSNSFGLERLHSWSRVSSQMDTCVIGQTSTPPPRPNTCFALHNFVMASNVFYWSGLARKFSPLVFLSTAAGYLLQLIRLPESSHRTWNIYWIWI